MTRIRVRLCSYLVDFGKPFSLILLFLGRLFRNVILIVLLVSADEIAKLFPCLFGQPSSMVVPSDSEGLPSDQQLKVGVVLSGGQAPGGHNVICGIFGEGLFANIVFGEFCMFGGYMLLIVFADS